MGLYNNGVYGPYSGRVGNVIGSFWKGRCIMRIRAANFTDANTIPQQTQRMKFKIISSFLRSHEKLIRIGFAAANDSLTAFNSALKVNIEKAITGVFPALALDPAKVKISSGDLLGLQTATVTSTVPGIVKIEWDDNSNSNDANVTDKLMVSIMDDASGEVFLSGTEATRSTGTVNINLPASWSGRNVHVNAYLVKDVDRITSQKHVSESEYLGTAIVA